MVICLIVLFIFGSVYAIGDKIEYSPSLYILWNHAVVEGQLLSHDTVEPREWTSNRKYKTNIGTVLVTKVLRQANGVGFSPGDTISFLYPYGRPISEVEGLEYIGGQFSDPKDLTVGSHGLFSFKVNKRGVMPGKWFYQTEERLPAIESFVAKFEADSTGTITEFKSQYPNLRVRLELSK